MTEALSCDGGGRMKQETANQLAQATPAVAGTLYASITLNNIVAALTGVYVIAQLAYLLWKWRREARAKETS